MFKNLDDSKVCPKLSDGPTDSESPLCKFTYGKTLPHPKVDHAT
jgi:hypothetical protein